MKISVITVVFNDKAGFIKTFESINTQTCRDDIEYIVIDGASTDGTSDVIRANCQKIEKFIIEKDKGIYDAMNKGLSLSSGNYVAFLNAGDTYDGPEVIANIIDVIEKGGQLSTVVYGSYREVNGEVISKVIPCRKPDKIWYGPVASHQSMFYNLKAIKNMELQYDTSYRIAADYKFTLSLLHNSGTGLKTDICVSRFDITGVSNKNQNQGLAEANRARREVLGWGSCRLFGMTCLLKSARYMKKYMRPVYSLLRNR